MARGFKVLGVEESKAKFNEINRFISDGIRNQVIKSALRIETHAKKNAPVDTGRLRASIQFQLNKDGFEADVFSDVNYAIFIEKGTRPHFPPPVIALERWAKRHGMEGLEFVIARDINIRGTPPRPFLFPAWEDERPNFINGIRKVVRKSENL